MNDSIPLDTNRPDESMKYFKSNDTFCQPFDNRIVGGWLGDPETRQTFTQGRRMRN